MDALNEIYRCSLNSARAEANKKVIEVQRSYDLLKDKNSDYAVMFKQMLDLYIESAEVYNNAPSDIGELK